MRKKLDKLSDTLGSLLHARGMLGRLSEYRILGRWEKAVGEGIARHARPMTLRAGKLYLVVDSPAWMQQLSMMKPVIIEKVNSALGKQVVKEIALNLGEIEAKEMRSERPIIRYELTKEERVKIEETVGTVQDSDVRDAIRRVMEKDYLRKKEKR